MRKGRAFFGLSELEVEPLSWNPSNDDPEIVI